MQDLSIPADAWAAIATAAAALVALLLGLVETRRARRDSREARVERDYARLAQAAAEQRERRSKWRAERRVDRAQAEQVVVVPATGKANRERTGWLIVYNYSPLPVFDIRGALLAPQDLAEASRGRLRRIGPGERAACAAHAEPALEGAWIRGVVFRDVTGRRWARGIDGTLRFVESVVDVDELADDYLDGPP